jgi:hypothetical protein
MTKYQEKTFKSYIQTIECWSRDLETAWNLWDENKPSKDIINLTEDLKKVRVAFFSWFKKQIK